MGFMDKAKKLAEQAQQKLDEAQTQFNQNASPQSPPGESAVQYDEHGRPVQEGPPAGEAAPPPAQPTPDPAAAGPSEPAAPGPSEPAAATPDPPRPSPSGDANATPDPFKPLQ